MKTTAWRYPPTPSVISVTRARVDASRQTAAVVRIKGDTWRILGAGTYADGGVVCHLASTTRFRAGGNGSVPVQEFLSVPAEMAETALCRPRGFYIWNRALRGAFERGERAQGAGLHLTKCPYADKRQASGKLTWSRAFEAAWRDGFRHAEKACGATSAGLSLNATPRSHA